jgi:hypothetical protein
MTGWEVIGVVLLCLTWGLGRREAVRRKRAAASVAAAARELGLQAGGDVLLAGHCRGFQVRLAAANARLRPELIVESVPGSGAGIPQALEIRAVSVIERLSGHAHVETGDEAFDNAIDVQGDRAPTLAVLDAETRALLDRAVAGDLRVKEGKVVYGVARAMQDGPTLVREMLWAVALAGRLRISSDEVAERLARNARQDPCDEVREHNLETLLDEFSDAPATRSVLRDLCEDGSPALQLRAALRLGEEGLGTLARLVSEEEEAGEWLTLEALEELVKRLPTDRLWPVLDAALAYQSPWVRRRALEAAIAVGGAPALERLARVLADDESVLAAQAARAIGRAGDASYEPALIQALSSEALELRQAAVEALGQVGTVAAVRPLQRATEGVIGVLAHDLHAAARAAIASIQSRVPAAAKGELSLAGGDPQDGRLSLTRPGDDGRVSLTTSDESPEA